MNINENWDSVNPFASITGYIYNACVFTTIPFGIACTSIQAITINHPVVIFLFLLIVESFIKKSPPINLMSFIIFYYE